MLPDPCSVAVRVPALATFVPSHTVDVDVVFVAALGAELTVNVAVDVVCGHCPFAATVYVIVTSSSAPISDVT